MEEEEKNVATVDLRLRQTEAQLSHLIIQNRQNHN
jgi:hypothetical protein